MTSKGASISCQTPCPHAAGWAIQARRKGKWKMGHGCLKNNYLHNLQHNLGKTSPNFLAFPLLQAVELYLHVFLSKETISVPKTKDAHASIPGYLQTGYLTVGFKFYHHSDLKWNCNFSKNNSSSLMFSHKKELLMLQVAAVLHNHPLAREGIWPVWAGLDTDARRIWMLKIMLNPHFKGGNVKGKDLYKNKKCCYRLG